MNGQSRIITGVLFDNSGEVVTDANIYSEDFKYVVGSDGDGYFDLSIPIELDALIISHISYGEQRLVLSDEDIYDVELIGNNHLPEVVVMAIGPHRCVVECICGGYATGPDLEGDEKWQVISKNLTGALMIYPNPSFGHININLPADSGELSIYDMTGRLVYQKLIQNNHTVQLDLSILPSATYFTKYRYDQHQWMSGKIVLLSE